MPYLLAATPIKAPNEMNESNSTQMAQHRVLAGDVGRDYFGSNKRVWILKYSNVQKADFDVIDGIYDTYLSTGTVVAWQSTETNYTIAATTVHVDLQEREFSVAGASYLSSFTLVLTEA